MKQTKRILALITVFVMVLSFAATSFAAIGLTPIDKSGVPGLDPIVSPTLGLIPEGQFGASGGKSVGWERDNSARGEIFGAPTPTPALSLLPSGGQQGYALPGGTRAAIQNSEIDAGNGNCSISLSIVFDASSVSTAHPSSYSISLSRRSGTSGGTTTVFANRTVNVDTTDGGSVLISGLSRRSTSYSTYYYTLDFDTGTAPAGYKLSATLTPNGFTLGSDDTISFSSNNQTRSLTLTLKYEKDTSISMGDGSRELTINPIRFASGSASSYHQSSYTFVLQRRSGSRWLQVGDPFTVSAEDGVTLTDLSDYTYRIRLSDSSIPEGVELTESYSPSTVELSNYNRSDDITVTLNYEVQGAAHIDVAFDGTMTFEIPEVRKVEVPVTVDDEGLSVILYPGTDREVVFPRASDSVWEDRSTGSGGSEWNSTLSGEAIPQDIPLSNFSINATVTLDFSGLTASEKLFVQEHWLGPVNGNSYSFAMEGFVPSENVCPGSGSTKGYDFEIDITALYNELAKEHGLTITKVFAGVEANEQPADFVITVTGTQNAEHVYHLYPDADHPVMEEHPAIRFSGSGTANDPYTWVIFPIHAGSYTVEEANAAIEGYTLSTTGLGTVTIGEDDDENAVAAITNTYSANPTRGSLTITKTFAGLDEAEIPEDLSFILTDANGNPYTVSLESMDTEDGLTYSINVPDLEAGSYILYETGANVVGYTFSTAGLGAVTVEAGRVAERTVTNTYTPQTGSLTITKTFEGISGDQIPGSIRIIVEGPDYEKSFDLFDFFEGSVGEGVFSMTLQEMKLGTYTVTEDVPAVNGYDRSTSYNGTVGESGSISLTAEALNGSMHIVNSYEQQLGSLIIMKESEGATTPEDTLFTVTGPEGYSETILYSEFDEEEEVASYQLSGLVPGEYTVTEDEESAQLSGYDLTVKVGNIGNSQTITVTDTSVVTFTNTYTPQTGDLTVNKVFEGLPEDKYPTSVDFTVSGPDNYSKTFTLSADNNWTYTVADLPLGSYTVKEETLTDVAGYSLAETSYSAQGGTVELSVDGASVTITNRYTLDVGDLTIEKIFEGSEVEIPEGLSFTVTGPADYSETILYSEFENGSYSILDLPTGEYTVTESGGGVKGYTLETSYSSEGGKAEVTVNGATLTVTNTYTRDTGELFIIKKATGATTPADATFIITGDNGYSTTIKYSDLTDDQYILKGVPTGRYSIAESGAEVEGYTLTTTCGSNILVVKGGQGKLTVTNTYVRETADLAIEKIVEGDAKMPETAIFTVTGPSDFQTLEIRYSQFTDGRYILEDVPTGMYTVTENEESAAVSGYSLTVSGSGQSVEVAANLPAVPTATITNTYSRDLGSLTIKKSFSGVDSIPEDTLFTVIGPDDYKLEIKYSQFENGSYSIEDLPTGEYTVTESAAEVKDYTLETTYSSEGGKAEVTVNGATLTVTNSYKRDSGKLYIIKKATGATTPADATFTITGDNGYSTTIKYSDLINDKYTLEDVPTGWYRIAESGAELEGYTLTSTCSSNIPLVNGGESLLTVTNTYTRDKGTLTIVKVEDGADTPADTLFTVIGPDDYELEIAYSEFENGSYSILDLPTGEYLVTESGAELEGYSLETSYSSEGKAIVTTGGEATLTVTNTYTRDLGSLTIVKVEEGADSPADTLFTVVGPEDYKREIKYSDLENKSYTLTDLPTGEYTVTESGAELWGHTRTTAYSNDGKATVTKDGEATVTVTNTYTRDKGTLIIVKDQEGADTPADTLFTVTKGGMEDYKRDIKYSEFENGSYSILDLPTGEYTVTESGAEIEGYSLTIAYSNGGKGTVTKDGEATVTVTNTYERDKGSLTITKTFEGISDEQIPGQLYFQLMDMEGEVLAELAYSEFENGSYTFEDLPTGSYSVREREAELEGYSLETSYSNDGEATVTKGGEATLTVTNTYTRDLGSLSIEKSFSGLPESLRPESVSFSIEGPADYTGSTEISLPTAEGAWSITLTDLPTGEYSVTETEAAAVTGYTLTVPAARTARVEKEAAASFSFENVYERDLGDLTIVKSFAGDILDQDMPESVSFTVTGPGGFNESYSLSEEKGWSMTLSLPTGEYTVTENVTDAQVQGYNLTVSDNGQLTVEVEKDEETEAAFTNSYEMWGEFTLLIPVEKTVEQKGNMRPTARNFSFVLAQNGDELTSLSLATNGAGSYSGDIVMSFESYDELRSFVEEGGLTVYEVKEQHPDWIYDETVYEVSVSLPQSEEEAPVVSLNGEATASFTNAYTWVFEGVDIVVNKRWVGGAAESVTFALYGDSVLMDTVTLTAKDYWTYTWGNMDAGIYWTVKEVNAPAGYLSSMERGYDANGDLVFNFTNTKVSGGIKPPQTGSLSLMGYGLVTLAASAFAVSRKKRG